MSPCGGHYAIAEIFKPNGIYRRWGWPGITAYLVGFVCMIPVFSAAPLFTGFVASAMNDADISMFIGLPISAVLYWALTRNLDIDAGDCVDQEPAGELEDPPNSKISQAG